MQNYRISRLQMDRGLFLDAHPRPYPLGRGPSAPQFLEILSIYAHTLYHRTVRLDVVTHTWKGLVLGGYQRQCVCTNTSGCLSAIDEFLV